MKRILYAMASVALFLTTVSPLMAQTPVATRTPWQMHDGLEVTESNPRGLIQFDCTPSRHGDICEYNVSTIPESDDPGWRAAPNGEYIDFSIPSRVCYAPITCMRYGDFTYFQTFVDIPAGVEVTMFTIAFSGMDDGSRVTIYNSAYPDGLVIDDSYVYLGGSGTTSLHEYVRSGEINRVAITQVDDCCRENNLRRAVVVLNGEPVDVTEGASLLPASAELETGDTHTLCVTLFNDLGDNLPNRDVEINIVSGPNAGMSWQVVTGANGEACVSYAGTATGTDEIVASFTNSDGEIQYSNTARAEWTGDVPPVDCVWADGTVAPLDNGEDGHGVSWGDFDGDGDDDLFLANAGDNKLLRNDGGGTFTEMPALPFSGGDSRGAAWGDYDNDGDLDLYVVNYGSSNRLYRNDGGVFVDVTAGDLGCVLKGNNAAWADYDHDGDLDLFFTNYDGPNKLLNNDGGTFTIVVSEVGFTDLSRGCAWGDYDNDGWLDLYVSVEDGPNHLFRNSRGIMMDVTAAPLDDMGKGKGVAWGDYDNDGDLDLYLVNRFTANRLFVNNGAGEFVTSDDAATADTGDGRACGWGDYNNDGWLDLFITNWSSGSNKLFYNKMGTSFADTTCGALLTRVTAWGMGWNDYDGDGDLDIYVQNHNWMGNPSYMFRNDLITTNTWLSVELDGVQSNSKGVGAKIVAVDPMTGISMMREIGAGSSYLSQPSSVAQFGLGDAAWIDLTIYWPSGTVQPLKGMPVNRRLVVTEASGPTGVNEINRPAYFVSNHPNPFNPTTNIEFSLPAAGAVTLQVYDVNGRLVDTLLSGASYPAGTNSVVWNGRDDGGRVVSSGVYFYRFASGAHEQTGRMVLLK